MDVLYKRIFTEETLAILVGLDHIQQQSYDKWVIVSDSMSVLKGLSNPRHNAKSNYIIHHKRERYFEYSCPGLWSINDNRSICK